MPALTPISSSRVIPGLRGIPEVITTTSDEYADAFGFTEKEVFEALEERGLGSEKQKVKEWYDGFIFGEHRDIYNPWSILNFLDKGKFDITVWSEN